MALDQVAFELNLRQEQVVKVSGIGCSSKAANYWMGQSYGFNGVHGRMPTIATGIHCVNRDLTLLGVSGDGDTSNIGIGHYIHLIRRNVDMTYIIENNGVYGLTKGQFSATADPGSKTKRGVPNVYKSIDCATLAMELGATFVGRGFSGDRKQLVALIKSAIHHKGFALLDIISPCVTFNNHVGSTKSFTYTKEHKQDLHHIDFVPEQEPIETDIAEGEVQQITLFDGSRITLRKVDKDHDPHDRYKTMVRVRKASEQGEILTGLLYVDEGNTQTLDKTLNLTQEPLHSLPAEALHIPKAQFEKMVRSYA